MSLILEILKACKIAINGINTFQTIGSELSLAVVAAEDAFAAVQAGNALVKKADTQEIVAHPTFPTETNLKVLGIKDLTKVSLDKPPEPTVAPTLTPPPAIQVQPFGGPQQKVGEAPSDAAAIQAAETAAAATNAKAIEDATNKAVAEADAAAAAQAAAEAATKGKNNK